VKYGGENAPTTTRYFVTLSHYLNTLKDIENDMQSLEIVKNSYERIMTQAQEQARNSKIDITFIDENWKGKLTEFEKKIAGLLDDFKKIKKEISSPKKQDNL
jgi:uncharacterized membrane protein